MYCVNTVLAGGISPHAIANGKQKERRKVILFLEMHKLFAGIFVTGWK
jgi:hypothetical protein